MKREITAADFAAIDAIYTAYMACNTADLPLAWGIKTTDAMSKLADAAKTAWRMLGLTNQQANNAWWIMCDGGSGAEYSYRYLFDHPDDFRRYRRY